MRHEHVSKALQTLLGWPAALAAREAAYMAKLGMLQYDRYRQFEPGHRFLSHLVDWLRQFDAPDREAAYLFIRSRLVFLGSDKMKRLVEQFYPGTVRHQMNSAVAADEAAPIPVFLDAKWQAKRARLLRQTLFMGLSDGAPMADLRRVNAGIIKNEQVWNSAFLDRETWSRLIQKLRDDVADQSAKFRHVYLLDDFVATGTSCLRFDKAGRRWRGKVARFLSSCEQVAADVFEDRWSLGIHHFVATHDGARLLQERVDSLRADINMLKTPTHVQLSFGYLLDQSLRITSSQSDEALIALFERYYDPQLRTKYTDEGDAQHLGLGYGACALPLVLEHNTPNNSVALLWALSAQDAASAGCHKMRPLFPRRQRLTVAP